MGILQHSLLLDPKYAGTEVERVGLFPKGYITIVAGEPGVGKTWFMLDICRAVAFGGIGMGSECERYKQGKVLVFAGETGFRMLVDRMQMLGGLGDEISRVRVISSHEMARLDVDVMLNTAYGRKNIEGAILEFRPDIVFFDTMISFMGGGKDESSQADMTDIIRGMSMIAGRYGCAVVLLHHFRKGQKGVVRDGFRTMDEVIGSSAFVRLAAMVVGLERKKEVRYVHCLKSWWKEFAPFSFILRSKDGGVQIEKTYGYADDGIRSVNSTAAMVLQWIVSHWTEDYFCVADICGEVEASRESVALGIRMGVKNSLIYEAGRQGKTSYYTIKPDLAAR